MTSVISIVGKKGSGKSEILEKLIYKLSRKGYRIGVIKHLARPDLEVDEPGKDTYRYRTGGAERVVLAGKSRLALFSNLKEELPLEELLNFFKGFDLVFLEGTLKETIPVIEIVNGESMDLNRLASSIEERFLKTAPAATV